MVPLLGWQNTEVVKAKGLHPESKESAVINVLANSVSNDSNQYATLMLWKKSGEKWKNSELLPVKKIQQEKGRVAIEFTDGTKKIIY